MQWGSSEVVHTPPNWCAFITFRVMRGQGDMYIGHGRLWVCVSVCLSVCPSLAAFPHYCTDPDVTWGNGRGCPLVVHYWADLQSVHAFRYYDDIAPNVKCQWMLVLALCLVFVLWYALNPVDTNLWQTSLFASCVAVPCTWLIVSDTCVHWNDVLATVVQW